MGNFGWFRRFLGGDYNWTLTNDMLVTTQATNIRI